MEDRPDYVMPNHVGTAVPENMADRPDYHGSLNPLPGKQREAVGLKFNPNDADLLNPANQLNRGLDMGNRQQDIQSIYDQWSKSMSNQVQISTSPIKVFTVCVDPGAGKYLAFLGSDPAKKATGSSRSEALHTLLVHNKVITETEID